VHVGEMRRIPWLCRRRQGRTDEERERVAVRGEVAESGLQPPSVNDLLAKPLNDAMADYSSPTDEKRPLPSVAGTGASKVENSSVPSSTKAISQPRASSSPFSSPSPPPPEPWFSRIYRYLLYGGIAYVAFLLALTIPVVQRK
jgi:hypothetical protein